MRLKVSEILSTMDQFNGMGKYSGQYEGGELVDINTNLPEAPTQAQVSESVEQMIKDMLIENTVRNKRRSLLDHPDSNVLSFERFLKEQKGTPSNVQSYFGCLDDENDIEEEE